MKILVTGAAGFIGSKLAYELAKRGDEGIGVDNINDYYDVRLKDQKMFLTTDSLYYDTRTSTAHIVGPSNITSGSATFSPFI